MILNRIYYRINEYMNAFDIRNIKKGNVTCIFKTSSTQNNLRERE